jgi:hypothetical protein
VFGTVCREDSVFGTGLYVEECVRYSVVGRRVCSVQSCRWRSVLSCKYESLFEDCLYSWHVNNLNHSCTCICLPADEFSGSKDVKYMVKIILV